MFVNVLMLKYDSIACEKVVCIQMYMPSYSMVIVAAALIIFQIS